MHSIDLIHDDLKLAQFLLGNNDHIKLNDFSRTKERVWDPLLKRFKVYRNSGRHGDCRSPEEYAEKELTEKIDIFSLGSIMFSLLTGLIPFDEITDEKEMMDKFMAGKLPFIDPRYKNRDSIERKFVEVMEDCWKFKPEDRPTAVEVARRLEELVMEESV
jgi:serine/threonine protein kinase